MKTAELRTFLTLLFFSVLIFFVDGTGLLNPLKSAAEVIITPVQSVIYSAKLSGEEALSFLTFWRSGEARIKNLELRNLELTASEGRAKALETENAQLRQQLGVTGLAGHKQLPAQVLGVGRYLEITAGAQDGVAEGQTVAYLDNLVGRVIRVTSRVSFVQLPTDPQAKVPVKIGQTRGLVIGQFNSSILLDRVAQTESVNKNDLVTTSGEGESYIPNLTVGKVAQITSKETDLFKTAAVVPLINYSDLSQVFVILD